MKEDAPGRVNPVWFSWQLHARHSGYHQIVRYLAPGDAGAAPRLSPPARLLRAVLKGWPQRRWLAPFLLEVLSGTPLYSADSLAAEADVAWPIAFRRRQVFHFIYGDHSYRYAGRTPRLKGSKLVATYHLPPALLDSHAFARAGHRHLRRLDGVIAVASVQAEYFARFVPRERVFVVPHGIDTGFFRPRDAAGPGDPDLCLFVGDHLRDFATLQAVIRILNASRPRTRFVLVTPARNAPLLSGAANVVIENNLTDEELRQRYQAAALHLQPMKDCTANNSILEGMACGLPTVATDIGGVRDYLDGSSSVLVPPGDAERMAAEAMALLEDPPRRRRLSDGGRASALKFEWGRIAARLRQVYDAVLR